MKKRIISTMLALIMGITAFVPLSVQASSTPSSWAVDEVNEAIDANLVTSSVQNDYQANITREQFCEMVVRAYEKISGEVAETGSVSFNDTSNGEILKAANLGIVSGYGGGKFGPDDLITREQIAAMLVRMIDKAVSYANVNVYNSNNFSDSNRIDDWALPSVNFAYDKEIMQGVGDNKIAPLDNTTCEQAVLLVYRAVKKYDIGELYYSQPDEENLVTDEETEMTFINNELIIHAVSDTPIEDIEDLAEEYNGEVVGEITITDTYQIRFDDEYTYSDMCDLADELESEDCVSWVSLNMAFEIEADYYPSSDTEWTNDWGDEYPSGLNWGVEAINAPAAWNYRDYMRYTSVGVFDSCFYDHEDLSYSGRHYNDTERGSNHGTHVSGTIAAGFDNGKGISGVAPCVNLYGFAIYNSLVDKYGSKYGYTMLYEVAFTTLIVQDRCKVLNFSTNTGKLRAAAASDSYQPYIDEISAEANEVGKYLNCLLKAGFDFTVCVAAGNENSTKYYKYTNYKNPNDILYFEESDQQLLSEGYKETTLRGDYQALYNNLLNAIDIPEIKDRIIVVGSCKNNGKGTYEYSDFSGIGNRVDIMAPGEDIYSTIANGYKSDNGTSMATPHVSGVMAMLYSLDPTLSGDKVKEIIVNSAREISGCDYKMLDAEAAVEQVIHTCSITVLDDDTNEPVEGAVITYNGNEAVTDESGHYDILLPAGDYDVSVTCEGYEDTSTTVNVENDSEKTVYLKANVTDYSKYIGSYFLSAGGIKSGFGDELKVSDVTSEYIVFNYQHPYTGHIAKYTAETAYFNGSNSASCSGTWAYADKPEETHPITYTITLLPDSIQLHIYNDSGLWKDLAFDLITAAEAFSNHTPTVWLDEN